VEFLPASAKVRLRFGNGDVGEAAAQALWQDRPGLPDWVGVRIEPETGAALLVPTVPGHPTREGDVAEIPGDVIRAATDVDYRAFVARRAARWAKEWGQKLARLREERGLSQQQVASAAGIDRERLAGIEEGRVEFSLAQATRILTAMGGTVEDVRG
jgi:DNA-binding XRE family transcriptional regulator